MSVGEWEEGAQDDEVWDNEDEHHSYGKVCGTAASLMPDLPLCAVIRHLVLLQPGAQIVPLRRQQYSGVCPMPAHRSLNAKCLQPVKRGAPMHRETATACLPLIFNSI